MHKFFVRLIKFFFPLVCFILLIGFYYAKRDIYLDFGPYKNYSWKYSYQSLGDISTKKLLQSPVKYNSFIFGSSRSVGLYACYLQKKINKSQFFHYANWNETIGGIYAKMRLLDSLGLPFNNVFIYLDTDYTFDNEGICNNNDHYLLTGDNKYVYYLKHFRSFIPPLLDIDKLKILAGLKVTGVYPNWTSDLVTNDSNRLCGDDVLDHYDDTKMDKSYAHKIDSLKASGFLYKRPNKQLYKPNQISNSEVKILDKILALLHKHKAHYYVVLTPLYDQLKFSEKDSQILKTEFGNNLYDYSGINSITNDESNYPDKRHFLPYISKVMVDHILSNQTN
jgi:hypothetical protein